MEFDKTRCYSALNADELKAGDKVVVADNLVDLMEFVRKNDVHEIEDIFSEKCSERFGVCGMANYALAYLVERKENCTNCGGHCEVTAHPELDRCENWKPKTEKKAEKHYRPFKDTDELVKVWREKSKQVHSDYSLTMPYIWVLDKMNQCGQMGILITKYEKNYVQIEGDMIAMHALMADYTFLDNSPCGVEE